MTDHTKAAVKASEIIIKYGISSTPVNPLRILEKMDNVTVVSFADMSLSAGIRQSDLVPMFGKNQDAITYQFSDRGRKQFIVGYNSLLPFNMVQRALAREMGHIVLGHEKANRENAEEAACFSHHLLCPRPLIHAVQATGIRLTVDMLANLTGIFDQFLHRIRSTPGADVPVRLNRFVRSQFMPFIINFFSFYQTVLPSDGSALADFGTYMENYNE